MSLYFPNVSELELMQAILNTMQFTMGLHKNVVSADGGLTMLTVNELTAGGGRTYASKALTMDFATIITADKWRISTNVAGKAEAQYSNDYLEWEFNANDVADGETVYGVFGYTNVIPFDAGAVEIKVGDIIEGGTSGATGIVTGVVVTSGTWGQAPPPASFSSKPRPAPSRTMKTSSSVAKPARLRSTPPGPATPKVTLFPSPRPAHPGPRW